MTDSPLPNYNSYVLRVWHEGQADSLRIVLQNTTDGQRAHFTDLQRLLAFLQEQNEIPVDTPS